MPLINPLLPNYIVTFWAKPKFDPGAYFAVIHLNIWLEKNKDPPNDTINELFKKGSNPLLVNISYDHPGKPTY